MTADEAIEKMRAYPGGSYLRCPFCGCKSRIHEEGCAVEAVAELLDAVRRYVWIHDNGDMGATDALEKQDAWRDLKKSARPLSPDILGERS